MRRTMGEPEAREFMERLYDEVFHRGNVDALSVAFSENHVAHGSGCLPGGERKSISQPRETVVRMRGALPDLVVTVEKVVASAGEGTFEIACCYGLEGTHRGWLQGLGRPSGW